MATQVIMPQLGESVVEGTVTRWLKNEGESVAEFEALLEVNTDKVDTEIPAPAAGALLKIYVEEGQTVGSGTVLAMVGEPGERAPQDQPPPVATAASHGAPPTTPPPSAAAVSPPTTADRMPEGEGSRRDLGFISPVVARIAGEHGVDLAQVRGSGRGGRITKQDVLAYLSAAPAAAPAPWDTPASGELFRPSEEVFGAPTSPTPTAAAGPKPGTRLPIDPVRRAIAEHMVRSVKTSPHVSTVMEVDMSMVSAHRAANKAAYAAEGINLTFSAYFAAAAVEALKAIPLVNASWAEDGILLHPSVNLGLAVSLGEQGLIVPVIKNAEQKSLRALAAEVNDLANRARGRQLRPDEVQGGTFTITNHGVGGSLFAAPIIHQPQAAILGVGTIQKRVVVVEGRGAGGETIDAFAIRPMVYLSLTFDHRILDGAVGDQFLGLIVQRLAGWR